MNELGRVSRSFRWRRCFFLLVLYYQDGQPDGRGYVTGQRVDGHMLFARCPAYGECVYCLQPYEFYPDMPLSFQDYGNGRRDCAYSDEVLHPDSLSFARAVLGQAILGSGKASWVFPG